LVLAIAEVIGPTSPALAQRDKVLYVACYVYRVPSSSGLYLPVVRSTQWDVFNNFESKAERGVLPNREPGQFLSCEVGDTPEAASAARVATGYLRAGELAWPKGLVLSATPEPTIAPKPGPAPKPTPKPTPPTTGLTVKADTSAKDAARAWDAQVAKALADEAQKRAQTAIKQARNDAKMQADAERARQERVKRGRAQ
jgi:hypothetical protein